MIVAPARSALIRAGIVIGGVAVLLAELLSALGALHRLWIVLAWLLVASGGALLLHRRRAVPPIPRSWSSWASWARKYWESAPLAERLAAGALGVLFLADLLVALVAPPNNFDSQTYHLPKIEHWVARGDVGFYPTVIDRQLAMAPGAEYLLLHLRLLTGGDGLYNLVQFAAAVGGALIASRITAQLGGDRRAQLLAALVFGTTPMVLLEATSTQTDLVVALWVGSVATLVLDELRRPTSWLSMLMLGTAAGLTLLTKATGLLAVGPLLVVWFFAQLRLGRWRAVGRPLLGTLVIVFCMAALAGPYLARVQTAYDHPLGPDHLRESISMQRHDPASVLINALRITETALQTPLGPVGSGAVKSLASLLGVDPSARDITYWNSTYPYTSWPPDEDRVSFPVQGALVLIGALALLMRRSPAVVRLYAALFWLAVLAYVVMVKWQPWGNRLIMFLLLLGTPLAALWVNGVLRWSADRRRAVSWLTAAVLAAGTLAGGFAVAYGWPRRLVGHGSVFTSSELDQRFIRRPEWQADYVWAADAVKAAGARRVGLLQGYNTWEYPWWVLLSGRTIVSLQSLQPDLPAAALDDVDAVLCVSPPKPCEIYIPPTWFPKRQGEVVYALRPSP
ncbi:hypothetical protein Drose_02125 [Dactylosporangium roseum]|uniref:Glycosyltransferase RgtA/B/C/D-like domain-containing protein n=1 Tax=Dactylosporangium roseum TaxID=47989 RepID=A0ABY5Z4Z4_9ACTN|nr:hypothetical protein [Dactylosporangium roseum]UWZ37133.1 hypothetical protein Drose_02125 [Dactylosporangium roseum]